MTKKTERNGAATKSATAIAAVLLAVPSSAASVQQNKAGPAAESSERTSAAKEPAKKISLGFAKVNIEYKLKGEYWVTGEARNHIVFEDTSENLFYVDAATGNQKFVFRNSPYRYTEYKGIKYSGKVRIVGVDTGENVIMRNAKGENFYISPANGDFIFVHNVVGR